MARLLEDKVASAPTTPGVYLFKDTKGVVVYVGKATNLRDRLRAYASGSDERAFVALLDGVLGDVELVLTTNEKEALLLENEFIKAHKPRFNVKLVDDKRYLALRLDLRQRYPRLEVVRQLRRDGARYFGPYASASSFRATLRIVNRHFQLRTCSDEVLRSRTRPCLQFQIKRCPAPCVFEIESDYARHVGSVVAFLEGRTEDLAQDLEARMQAAAAEQSYEVAALLRDQWRAVKASLETQRVFQHDFIERDVLGLYREGAAVEIHVMRVRGGRWLDARRFSLSAPERSTTEVLSEFVSQYYAGSPRDDVPSEVLCPTPVAFADTIAAVLAERAGHGVTVAIPQRGDKRRLVLLAERNARQAFVDKARTRGAAQDAIAGLQRSLHLHKLPERIECFDISHFQGKHVVASCVRLDAGLPRKELYRHYKIRSVVGQDDFQSIYEVLGRRARRGLEEGELPDLMVIDGGKGQLAAAKAALTDHGVDGVDVVALAKARDDEDSEPGSLRRFERVFVLGHKTPIVLRQDSGALFLLTRARDEAHRFAGRLQKKVRRRANLASTLDGISGLGPVRRRALLRAFGSVAALRDASADAIAEVVGPKLAAALVAHLHRAATP